MPLLVDFFADWCEPCSMLAPVLEKVAKELEGKLILAKANLDDIPKTAQLLGVERIPTVVLFENGKAKSGFVGVRPESAIKEWLAEMMGENSNEDNQKKIDEMIKWYENYAKENGFKLNPDKAAVERVMKGLLANEKKYGQKYCPCRRVSQNKEADAKNICPCVYHKDEIKKDSTCFCRLFVA